MAAPTVTYNLTNGTVADAGQVDQNFTDVINALTDNSKDISAGSFGTTSSIQYKLPTTLPSGDGLLHSNASGQMSVSNAITGSTDGSSASAGMVGEVLTFSVSNQALVSTTIFSLSLSLTAGDWDVRGNVNFSPGAGTSSTSLIAAINSSNASMGTNSDLGRISTPQSVSTNEDTQMALGPVVLTPATTTTYFLNIKSTFAGGTLAASAKVQARRMR